MIMSAIYRVVIQVSGGGGAGENVVWQGTIEEMKAEYGTDPIESSSGAAYFTVQHVIQRKTEDGWEDCADPRT